MFFQQQTSNQVPSMTRGALTYVRHRERLRSTCACMLRVRRWFPRSSAACCAAPQSSTCTTWIASVTCTRCTILGGHRWAGQRHAPVHRTTTWGVLGMRVAWSGAPCVCMRVHACVHACVHVCVHACVHVCVHACVHVWTWMGCSGVGLNESRFPPTYHACSVWPSIPRSLCFQLGVP